MKLKKRLNVSELLQFSELLADLPQTDEGVSPDVAEWLGVKRVEYAKDGDQLGLTVFYSDDEDDYDEFWVGDLLDAVGNMKAAIATAVALEYHQYEDNVSPFQYVRCAILSAIMGFDSGMNPDPDGEFTESERGIFMGSRNDIKMVTELSETVYPGIAQFLEAVL